MKRNVFSPALAAALIAGCSSGANAPVPSAGSNAAPSSSRDGSASYAVVNLGTLGGASSAASSINNHQWVSGLSSLPSSAYIHAALWKHQSSAQDLGTLGGPNSAIEWPLKNDSGLLAGISETPQMQPRGETWSCAKAFFPQPPTGHVCRGFAWRTNAMHRLPTLGGDNGIAAGANDRGEIVGWSETRQPDKSCVAPQVLKFEATLYDGWGKRKARELPPLRNDKDGAATEINDAGQVVGISGICDQAVGRFTARHAVMWEHGKPHELGSLGGVAWNTPMAINRHGTVVGFSDLAGDSDGSPNFHAFLWTKRGGMIDLGTLPGDVYSQALGINDAGQVVGASYGPSFSTSRAFIYENGTMTDLNALIPPSSQLYLLFANDINDRGEIAGGACAGASCAQAPAFLAIPGSRGAARVAPPVPHLPAGARALIRARALMPW